MKQCKWRGCTQQFEDAVEAFKHIRDTHLKPRQAPAKRRLEEVEAEPRKRIRAGS